MAVTIGESDESRVVREESENDGDCVKLVVKLDKKVDLGVNDVRADPIKVGTVVILGGLDGDNKGVA